MRRFVLFLALVWVVPALAQMGLEIISLQHRQADEVLPLIRPFLAPGASASGMNEKLFLRTTPANLAEIRKLVAAVDRAPKRLMIVVSDSRDEVAGSRGGELAGTLESGGRGSVTARVYDTRSAAAGRGRQSVQVVEGGRAYIQVGKSVPVPLRQVGIGPQGVVVSETVVYRDIGRGFYAQPQVSGDRVAIEISQQADTPSPAGPGATKFERLATTVSGRLGEWIALGGTDSGGEARGTFSLSTRELREQRAIWLKVEEVP